MSVCFQTYSFRKKSETNIKPFFKWIGKLVCEALGGCSADPCQEGCREVKGVELLGVCLPTLLNFAKGDVSIFLLHASDLNISTMTFVRHEPLNFFYEHKAIFCLCPRKKC